MILKNKNLIKIILFNKAQIKKLLKRHFYTLSMGGFLLFPSYGALACPQLEGKYICQSTSSILEVTRIQENGLQRYEFNYSDANDGQAISSYSVIADNSPYPQNGNFSLITRCLGETLEETLAETVLKVTSSEVTGNSSMVIPQSVTITESREYYRNTLTNCTNCELLPSTNWSEKDAVLIPDVYVEESKEYSDSVRMKTTYSLDESGQLNRHIVTMIPQTDLKVNPIVEKKLSLRESLTWLAHSFTGGAFGEFLQKETTQKMARDSFRVNYYYAELVEGHPCQRLSEEP